MFDVQWVNAAMLIAAGWLGRSGTEWRENWSDGLNAFSSTALIIVAIGCAFVGWPR